ncbi:hypothetical protein [Porphyromonas macacae]|nr:hypothetical protein [Porphyromonas macacae]
MAETGLKLCGHDAGQRATPAEKSQVAQLFIFLFIFYYGIKV